MNFHFDFAVSNGFKVSIHIRHCWRMNFCTLGVTVQDAEFQSTFAIAGE